MAARRSDCSIADIFGIEFGHCSSGLCFRCCLVLMYGLWMLHTPLGAKTHVGVDIRQFSTQEKKEKTAVLTEDSMLLVMRFLVRQSLVILGKDWAWSKAWSKA